MVSSQRSNPGDTKARTVGYQGIRSVPSRVQAPGAEMIQVGAPTAAAIFEVALAKPTVRSSASDSAARSSRSSFRSMPDGVQMSTPRLRWAHSISAAQSPYWTLTKLTPGVFSSGAQSSKGE